MDFDRDVELTFVKYILNLNTFFIDFSPWVFPEMSEALGGMFVSDMAGIIRYTSPKDFHQLGPTGPSWS